MTENQRKAPDPSPADDEDAALRALAARYFDLWQENWAVFLSPPDPNAPDPGETGGE